MKAAVLGAPIAHSLSPVLHRAAYQALGLTGWSYEAIECDTARLPALLDGCGPGWAGLSLTMPLKRAVLPLLDHIDPLTREVGAANTVVFTGGQRHGHNTDVPGMIAALAEARVTGLPRPATVLILGGEWLDVVEEGQHGALERHGQRQTRPVRAAGGEEAGQGCLVALNGLVGPAGEAECPVAGPMQGRRQGMRDR